ncbi:MAG: trypsin-like peptidase domain-containing protein [Flavobacterium sp.]
MITAIFPIVSHNSNKKEWKCLGTGFFLNPVGAFVSAKHLFMDSDGHTETTLYGIQNFKNEEYHVRPATNLYPHNFSDLMIGTLGKRRTRTGENVETQLTEFFALDLEPLKIGDEIYTYAYPNTEREELVETEFEFTFTSSYSKGKIVEFHPDGFSILKNKCYQTDMNFDGGASGGPVFKNGYIVGINSTSYSDSLDDGDPISFITPIDYILDFAVNVEGNMVPILELIEKGFIKIK